MTDILNKDYIRSYYGMVETDFLSKSGKSGHTYPLFSIDGDKRFSPESSELKTQYPFIGISDIGESMNTLRQFHYYTPSVFDYPCSDIEEPIPQGLDEPLLYMLGNASFLNQLTIL